jgi:cation:H+ antiporter
MLLLVFWLIISLAAILAAAELFTNAIEWFGRKLRLSEGAVGSVLAAVGTALPETTIAIVAIMAQEKAHTEAGIGAILGAPMMLATLAMFVTGLAVLIFSRMGLRTKTMLVDHKVFGRDLRSFFVVYTVALSAAFIPYRPCKIAIAVFLLGAYIYYVRNTLAEGRKSENKEDLHPLYFHKWVPEPKFPSIIFQLAAALLLMVGGAELFLFSVTALAPQIGISALVLSIIITPIATELPEKFNSITWIRKKKDTLALGNISGAMVFQSSVTPAIGILFTSWKLEADAVACIGIAVLAAAISWGEMTWHKRLSPYTLLFMGLLYVIYPILVFKVFR